MKTQVNPTRFASFGDLDTVYNICKEKPFRYFHQRWVNICARANAEKGSRAFKGR